MTPPRVERDPPAGGAAGLADLPGVGPARARALADAGIATPLDFLLALPFRYEDRSRLAPIGSVTPGSPPLTVGGTVREARLVRTRRPGFSVFSATIDDGSGALELVFFNQPYLARWVKAGTRLFAYGVPSPPRRRGGPVVLENPSVEAEPAEPLPQASTGRIVPIYRRLAGFPPRLRRRLVASTLDAVAESLPERLPVRVRAELGLPSLAAALCEAHFPGSAGGAEPAGPGRTPALARLAFEELLELSVGLRLRRAARAESDGPLLAATPEIRRRLGELLPFPLTGAQRRAIREIGADVRSGRPMLRLLHGDVGSGKTVVAVLTALLAAECGFQAVLMAPTTVLAEQHAASVFRMLRGTRFTPALLTSRVTGRPRRALLAALAAGEVHLLVGTHALHSDPVAFRRLGLVVIDEQHRFGVAQRALLTAKASEEKPHVLVMSATPIPRSLALALYGEMDVSTLDELPPGRSPIVTRVLPEGARGEAFAALEEELAAGGQGYVVVPLVEESDAVDARAVVRHAGEVRGALPGRRVGIVHGRLPAEEREATMSDFGAGRLDVLVATTVIEVGIDVPNASLLVVENAERFGLAQLHQLRGRVGRGARPSRCFLLHGEDAPAEAVRRLSVLARTTDGFAVAEEDLARRGPGDLLGTLQSGAPGFRVADPVRDLRWLEAAHRLGAELVAAGEAGPFATPLLLSGPSPDG